MQLRERFRQVMAFDTSLTPPRFESEFPDDTVATWRAAGHLGDKSPEQVFGIDRREDLGIAWRRTHGEKSVLHTEEDIAGLATTYDPADPDRIPKDWQARTTRWRNGEHCVFTKPWNEGFLQVLGIGNAVTLTDALTLLCERPNLAEAAMEHYASFLETLVERVLADVQVDFAFFYAPIASNHGPVVSPETYRRFVVPALRRTVDCLERHGVHYRFMWSAGNIHALIPLWLDTGINGLFLNRPHEAGMSYLGLREDFGNELRHLGGVNWQILMQGEGAIDEELRCNVAPLLEQGGYIPHLDDTVRSYVPFEAFRHYRRALDKLLP